MAELSTKEFHLLKNIIDEIESEYFQQSDSLYQKDILMLSLYQNDEEKNLYLKGELEAIVNQLKRCPNEISGFITALTYRHPQSIETTGKNIDIIERNINPVFSNFILDYYDEAFENLINNNVQIDTYLNYFNQYYEYKDEWFHLSELIRYAGILNRYETLKSISSQDSETKPSAKIEPSVNQELYEFIKKQLSEFENEFNKSEDYKNSIIIIANYFLNGKYEIIAPIFVKRGYIKKLAFAMGEIWRYQSNEPITFDYLMFCKKLFSVFKNQKIDKESVFSCNLYKYSISKT